MPYVVYKHIAMAVDSQILMQRKLFISDVALAFSDPKKGIRNLEQQEKLLEKMYYRSKENISVSNISWDFNPNAANQLKRWQR